MHRFPISHQSSYRWLIEIKHFLSFRNMYRFISSIPPTTKKMTLLWKGNSIVMEILLSSLNILLWDDQRNKSYSICGRTTPNKVKWYYFFFFFFFFACKSIRVPMSLNLATRREVSIAVENIELFSRR